MGGERVVLQAESTECGLACLAMVCAAHGRAETLSEMRRRFPVSLSGVNIGSLMGIADAVGFSTRAVRCELDELGKLSTPSILHWDLDHYVVLSSARRREAVILDPSRGRRVLPWAEISRHFTGVALELTPTPRFEKRKQVERVRLNDLWTRISGFYPTLAQLFLLTLLLQLFGLIMPIANQVVIDDAIGHDDRNLLLLAVVAFLVLAGVQTGLDLLRNFVQLHVGQMLSVQLSGNLLKHLLRLPTEFFERRHIGDIIGRFGSLSAIQEFLTKGVVGVLLDGVMLIPCGVIMVLYSPLLSGLVLIDVALALGVQALSFRVNRRFADESISLAAKAQSIFLETVRAVRAIKLSGRETERHAIWQNAVLDQQNLAYRQTAFSLWGGSGFGFLMSAQGLLLLFLGALEVMAGRMTLGMFMAFQAYAGQFSGRAKSLVSEGFNFRLLGLHLERLADVVHAEEEPHLDLGSSSPGPLQGALVLRAASFRYAPQDPWVLRDVDLRVEPGQRIALVGPSGGGKSTLLKILTGLYAPGEGDLLLDGMPLSTLGVRTYRGQIGVVMQDDSLLSGTIADNVAFFDPQIDMARVEEVCRLARVHDDVMRLPMGYHALIGDMGSILSGGQKQRVLLARALYKRPRYLFMDEGTANLDVVLEDAILSDLKRLEITQIMVAHRAAAIEFAQRIFLVADGALTEISSSAALVEAKP